MPLSPPQPQPQPQPLSQPPAPAPAPEGSRSPGLSLTGQAHSPGLSLTGQAVALTRLTFPRPSTPEGDGDAQSLLCAGMASAPIRSAPMRAHLEARTRFVDAQVLSAIGRGTAQIVALGAGYDDRALRFRSPGVHFFEVDHPVTQSDKRRRLERMGADLSGVTLVPADFRVDQVGAALERSGHRSDRPSLVVAEGLLVYLDQHAVVELLRGIRSRAVAGSVLVASLAVHPEGIDSAWVVERSNAARPAANAEPWRTILPASEHLDLVRRSGWRVVESVDDATLGTGAVPDRSLLVLAHPGDE
jgi:methyltransferase (TIGR00027 family)